MNSTMPALPEIMREHIVSCAEYAEHWLAQAAMWRECGKPDLSRETLKHAAQTSRSAFRWAIQHYAEAQMVADFRELTRA